jgi:hypothetical protein
MVVYLNNLKYSKLGKDFYLEPEFPDMLNEYMSSILFFDEEASTYTNKRNFFIIKPLKSKYDETEYFISVDKETFLVQ